MLCAIPLEIAVRELNGMLYQSLHLAAHGMPTIIGERMVDKYVEKSGKPVVYFDSDQCLPVNEAVLKNGGIVINVNPEGMHLSQAQQTLENFSRISDYVTRICTWGERQIVDLKSVFPQEKHESISATGYPPFDLTQQRFKPFHQNPEIIEKHSQDYILINTSYAYANNMMGYERYMKMLAKMEEWKIYNDPEYMDIQNAIFEHQKLMLTATVDLAKHLGKTFPDRHIIVRPHPGEDHTYYEERLTDLSNVYVEREKTAREWIASAATVIHHDCTTGMEALLMGCQVVHFRPHYDERAVAPLMPLMGIKTKTNQDVVEAIQLGSMPSEMYAEQIDILRPYLANIETSAAKIIADMAVSLIDDQKAWIPKPLGLIDSAKVWRKYISKLLRARQPGKNGRKVRYALNKFPRIPLNEIEDVVARLRKVEPELPEVTVEQLCLNTFLIKPKQ